MTGTPNHAGTTPMNQRHDALLAAARFVEIVNRVVLSEPGTQVGTVGRIQAWPGAPNVIPGRVSCTLELRDLDDAKIASGSRKVLDQHQIVGVCLPLDEDGLAIRRYRQAIGQIGPRGRGWSQHRDLAQFCRTGESIVGDRSARRP